MRSYTVSIFTFTMILCKGGRQAALKTSYTETNPGREFYTCSQMRSRCKFFVWHDPSLCCRSCVVIKGKGLMDTNVCLNTKSTI
ncbi:putative transcription factor GRF family [Helianthus anomalus]